MKKGKIALTCGWKFFFIISNKSLLCSGFYIPLHMPEDSGIYIQKPRSRGWLIAIISLDDNRLRDGNPYQWVVRRGSRRFTLRSFLFFFWETTQEQLLLCIGLDRLGYMWVTVAMVCVLFIFIFIKSGMGVLLCSTHPLPWTLAGRTAILQNRAHHCSRGYLDL